MVKTHKNSYELTVSIPAKVKKIGTIATLKVEKASKKYDTCVAFLNWLGSSDVQLDWSNNYGTIPCQKEALTQVSDDIKELMETLKPQDLDWSFIAENVDAWVEKAELEYVQ